ncbi:MAG: membrane lipoprotein lipid attachment site-containing protein [Paludibacteraceae bacterium]|nr:membrane lipoprotein lipid attachment site-containing protein [Paludibacteraceae bacterium]
MKKILFTLVAVLTLTACHRRADSSNIYDTRLVRNNVWTIIPSR